MYKLEVIEVKKAILAHLTAPFFAIFCNFSLILDGYKIKFLEFILFYLGVYVLLFKIIGFISFFKDMKLLKKILNIYGFLLVILAIFHSPYDNRWIFLVLIVVANVLANIYVIRTRNSV